jgi:hypothetical protein
MITAITASENAVNRSAVTIWTRMMCLFLVHHGRIREQPSRAEPDGNLRKLSVPFFPLGSMGDQPHLEASNSGAGFSLQQLGFEFKFFGDPSDRRLSRAWG